MSDDLRPCGDGACVMFGGRPATGLRTNGGCEHVKLRGPELVRLLRAMGREIAELRERLAARDGGE